MELVCAIEEEEPIVEAPPDTSEPEPEPAPPSEGESVDGDSPEPPKPKKKSSFGASFKKLTSSGESQPAEGESTCFALCAGTPEPPPKKTAMEKAKEAASNAKAKADEAKAKVMDKVKEKDEEQLFSDSFSSLTMGAINMNLDPTFSWGTPAYSYLCELADA